MPTKRTTTTLLAGLAFSFALVGCGSDPVEVPKVAGIRLDDAHNVLKDAGFQEFEDIDAISDRQPLIDANWVVVEQAPPAGDRMDQKDTVILKIAKPEDEGIREILPEDSPVLAEIRERDADTERRNAESARRAAEKERKDAEQRLADAKIYVGKVDPATRLAKAAIDEALVFGEDVAAGRASVLDIVGYKQAFASTMDSYIAILEGRDLPDHLESAVNDIHESVDGFGYYLETLYTAVGSTAENSIARSRIVYADHKSSYNDAVAKIYEGSSVAPPLL
ncbi:PASTA domain-containing protein [Rhodococcus baikonurensis]|uniref:PASTA domain-containing protein n=1 Tax=Rhodococcus baikonurensis TaxID=172041 RepID=UPI0037991686